MKKKIIIILAVIIVAAGVGYKVFHKSPKPAVSNSPAKTSVSKAKKPAEVNNSILITKNDANLGNYLADPTGKPLYTYNQDKKDVSNCTGSCLSSWPVYQATVTTGLPKNVGVITRKDNGGSQYTYKGQPLYYFTSDSVGRIMGDAVSGFYVAKP